MAGYSGKVVAVAMALSVLAGCLNQDKRPSAGRFTEDSYSFHAGGSAKGQLAAAGGGAGAYQRGSDSFIDADVMKSGRSEAIIAPADGNRVEIGLVNATVESAAKAILGDTLKMNYVIADDVDGRITIQTTGPVPKDVLLELFEAALAANGAQLRKSGNVIEIVRGTSGAKTFRLAANGAEGGSNILVAPLKFVSASEMANLMQPLTDEGLNVVSDKRRNLLLLSGPPLVLEAALDALNIFDVDVLTGKSVALVPLQSAQPEAIAEELQTIFETEEGGALNGVVEFVPNERLGSILVVSSRSAYLDRATRWIRELDKTSAGSTMRLGTYQLQNRSAVEVAPVLAELLGGTTQAAGGDEGEALAAADPDTIRVAADDSRNALLVRAPVAQHREIAGILRELDSVSRQVLLEATIAEVTLNDRLDVGTRWFFESGNWGFRNSDLDTGGTGGSNPGFTAVFGAGSASVALSALASVTDVKIISSPTLMVIDNKEGVLQIGDQVPIARQVATDTTNNAPVLTQVEYRDTGIILRVRPRVGSGGRVTLDISQEVSDVARTTTSGIDSPTISQRKVQTSVALSDGQTLALGGLVQETDNIVTTKTPGLGDVPVVGNLFRRKDSRRERTELLILIRPRVVTTPESAGTATSYWRTKLSGSNSILQTGLSSPKHTINDLAK